MNLKKTLAEYRKQQKRKQEARDDFILECMKLGFILIMLGIALLLASCTKTALKRIVIDPNGLISYTAFTNYECMMKSSMQDAEVVIEDKQGYRHYAIGSREQWPDPNSIEAAVEAAK